MANLRVDKITSTETFETTGSVQFGSGKTMKLSANSGFDLTEAKYDMAQMSDSHGGLGGF